VRRGLRIAAGFVLLTAGVCLVLAAADTGAVLVAVSGAVLVFGGLVCLPSPPRGGDHR